MAIVPGVHVAFQTEVQIRTFAEHEYGAGSCAPSRG